jgi:hypothetical protein
MLAHRNTPAWDTQMSSSEVVFGRKIKDLLPVHPMKLKMNPEWHRVLERREDALAKRHLKRGAELSEHTIKREPLKVGATVAVQNQSGNRPKRWDNTGTVVEVESFDKYVVKMDGSGRLTSRNRRYLKPIKTYQDKLKEDARDGSDESDEAEKPERRRSARATTMPRPWYSK